jgi:hypothetical protein
MRTVRAPRAHVRHAAALTSARHPRTRAAVARAGRARPVPRAGQHEQGVALAHPVQCGCVQRGRRGHAEEGELTPRTGQVVDLAEESPDPSNVAGLLKLFFRELPEALLTRDLAAAFVEAAGMCARAGRAAVRLCGRFCLCLCP